MKITQLEPQKNSTRRFNIYLDGEFAFGADENLVVNRRLVVGKEINNEDLEKIIQEAEVGKLMEKMYRLFSIRMRSEKEVRDYFRIKNQELRIKRKEEISSYIVDAAVQQMKKKVLINDEKFAKAWVESRSRKFGVNRIKQELIQKGIDRETIEEATRVKSLPVCKAGLESREEEIAERQLEKKLKIWKNLPEIEMKKKAYDYLLRRGFEYELVKEVVAKFLNKE